MPNNSEIKRIKLKNDDVMAIGDTRFFNDGNGLQNYRPTQGDLVIGESIRDVTSNGDDGWVERDLRPLAKGEERKQGDWLFSSLNETPYLWDEDCFPVQDKGRHQAYRPVRMQSEGWRYLDVGEPRTDMSQDAYGPETHLVWKETFYLLGQAADSLDTVRTPWPPRADVPTKSSDNCYTHEEYLEVRRVYANGIIKDLKPLQGHKHDAVKAASCVYCGEPDDDTMGVINEQFDSWRIHDSADRVHARCAQKASRLQTPDPEEVRVQVQHEDFV